MVQREIVALEGLDRDAVLGLARRTGVFTEEDMGVLADMFDGCRGAGRPCGLRFCGVRDEQGHLQGFVCFGRVRNSRNTVEIYWLAVDPDAQGNGIGHDLVEHVAMHARQEGAAQVLIETSSTGAYEAARAAYRRLGFVKVGGVPDYYREGDDRVSFARRLY